MDKAVEKLGAEYAGNSFFLCGNGKNLTFSSQFLPYIPTTSPQLSKKTRSLFQIVEAKDMQARDS